LTCGTVLLSFGPKDAAAKKEMVMASLADPKVIR
jgi:hypothetical protein